MADKPPERPPMLIIPGIGGHPRFHRHLVAGLGSIRAVHTASHVDFTSRPCSRWSTHIDHWLRELEVARFSSAEPVAVVGISFGAHVALALDEAASASISSLTLVSYRPLPTIERRLLRLAARRPDTVARLVGPLFFTLSERQVTDAAALKRERERLYDDPGLVARRLTARLVALADAPPTPAGLSDRLTLIAGDRERTLLRRYRRASLPATTVPGDHGISLRDVPALVDAVTIATGDVRRVGSDPRM
ncbi:alpha/beta hydrolase [Pseudonocardia benzenivorans]|uniref:Alpha/beta hydrolase n=1 Tax=Pseudonocardia benzenivorans TaxID=228005 RepID=A0ABW3VBN2_9PSEU